MKNPTRKFIPVSPDTHRQLKLQAVALDKTFDELINHLLESHLMSKKLKDYDYVGETNETSLPLIKTYPIVEVEGWGIPGGGAGTDKK